MLPLGALYASVGRQLGRILSLAFSWSTIAHRLNGILAAVRSLWPRRRQRASTRTG